MSRIRPGTTAWTKAMRNLQGSTDTELDQSMGRKAARLARKPHVVGSIALDQRLRAQEPGPAELVIETRQDETNPLKWHFKSEGGVPPITYDFGDGSTHTPSDGRNTAHTYAAPGEYHVEAEDAEDHVAEADIEVVIPPEPLAMTAKVDEANPLRWHFKTTGGTPPVTYDFGNGLTHSPADGRDTAHTYAAPGEYTVEATDAEDHVVEVTIEVAAPEVVASAFPWDAMTTHAQIDGWASAQGVAIGSEWPQMTLASKRQWLVTYFDGDRPWETGN